MTDTDVARLAEELAPRIAERLGAGTGPRCISTRELADRLGIAEITAEQMRHRGDGPAYHQIGRRIVYRLDDVERWLASHRRGGEAA